MIALVNQPRRRLPNLPRLIHTLLGGGEVAEAGFLSTLLEPVFALIQFLSAPNPLTLQLLYVSLRGITLNFAEVTA